MQTLGLMSYCQYWLDKGSRIIGPMDLAFRNLGFRITGIIGSGLGV